MQNAHHRPGQAHLIAGVFGKDDLVARLDALGLDAHSCDDARLATVLGAGGNDQARARLGFLIGRLNDDVVVQRLQREVKPARIFFDHPAFSIRADCVKERRSGAAVVTLTRLSTGQLN